MKVSATLLTATCATIALGHVAPTVPEVTPAQAAVAARTRTAAAAAAVPAREKLLRMLDGDVFRTYLKHQPGGAEYLRYSPEEVLAMMHAEYQVVEIVHNWEPLPWLHGRFADITLGSSIGYEYMFNIWQLDVLGFNSTGTSNVENTAETTIFELPEWKNPAKPTYTEASERLLYGDTNVLRRAMGNPYFGGVSFVFDNTHIYNSTVIAAVDTGLFENCCNPDVHKFFPSLYFNCSGWPNRTLGNFVDWEHTFLGHIATINETGHGPTPGSKNGTYAEFNFAQILPFWLNTNYTSIPACPSQWGYPEANPLMNLRYKEGIKLMILSYDDFLFGTVYGQELQAWAIANDWVVAYSTQSAVAGVENQRFLDPYVLSHISAGRNVTTSDPHFPALLHTFQTAWNYVNSTLPQIPSAKQAKWLAENFQTTFTSLEELRLAPLNRNSCKDPSCAGVRIHDGTCVCRV